MRCFSRFSNGRSRTATPDADEDTNNNSSSIPHTPTTPQTAAAAAAALSSSQASSSVTSPNPHHDHHHHQLTHTINLRREYNLAVQTDSYNEIWSKIQHHNPDDSPPSSPSIDLIDRVLQPDRSSIQEALSSARLTPHTRLVSQYLDTSENASHHFLALRRSVIRTLSIYAPITDLIEHLPPSDHDQFSQSQCDWAVAKFHEFDRAANPFPSPTSPEETTCNFDSLRVCFLELKQQLDSRLFRARLKHRLLRVATRSSSVCLIVSVAAVAVTGLVIAAHALVALVAVGPVCTCGGGDLLSKQRRKLREHMMQVDKTARETYALNNHLDMIERLVARLNSTVESDKVLVRLGLERGKGKGKGQRHSVQEVMRHLRKNHSRFLHQLRDLDVHIVLCLAAVNRARSLLIQQIHC